MPEPFPSIAEDCRCGASMSITAPLRAARSHVLDWRATHPCTTREEAHQDGVIGAGAASLGFTRTQRPLFGHIDLEVTA